MPEIDPFRIFVDLIKQQRRNSISEVVLVTVVLIPVTAVLIPVLIAGIIAFILLAIIGPSVFLLVDNDYPDDVADLWFGVWAIFHMFVDALFLYVPLINEETKCVMLDNRLKIAAIVLRSVGDLRYVLRIYLRIKRGMQNNDQENDREMTSRVDGRPEPPSLKKIAMSVAIDTVCILPVPQIVILIFLPKMRGSRSLKIMKFLNSLILLQYLPRLFPFFKMCKQVNRDMLDLFKKKNKEKLGRELPKWFGIAVNILGYILASHVLGAFWYFFSIQREIDCWGYACRIENGCEFSTSCVEKTFKNITHIKNLCPVNPPNATVFNFGIFLQSGMQGSTNFPEKFLQCFSWGLRNLSSFASNLNSSTYGWENLFVVVISISGLVLFMYLLGHSQTYMQETDRRESVKRKMKMIIKPKIQSLLSEYGLPDNRDMKRIIKAAVKLILEKDEDFILENMFSILSFNFPDERQYYKKYFDFSIKCELFSGKLKNVEGLKDKDEEVFEKICEHLEPMIYMDESYIIREREPLDKMFFITQGNVLTFATNNGGSSFSSGTSQLIEKEEDSWYGEELLTWAEQPSSKLSTLPMWTLTVKSHKKVEIFALKAADLQKVVSKFPSDFNTSHMEIVVHNNSSNISARRASREINEGRAKRGDVSKRDQGYQSC